MRLTKADLETPRVVSKKNGVSLTIYATKLPRTTDESRQLSFFTTHLEYVPPERLVITADCGFGREGLSRRIAFYKGVALVQGTNMVRKELGLPEVYVRAADPHFAFREV